MKVLLSSFHQQRQPRSQCFHFLRREGGEDRGDEVETVNSVKHLSHWKVWHLQVGGVAEVVSGHTRVPLSHVGAPQCDAVRA